MTNVIYVGLKKYLEDAHEIIEIPEEIIHNITAICYHLERAKEIQDNFDGKNIEEVDREMNYHNQKAFSKLADILPTLWY